MEAVDSITSVYGRRSIILGNLCKRWLADETGVFKSMCNNRF